jgi:NAD(P)-dependent dehydrogenase (short-subunit alcohol dehydrogenase family)
LVKNDFENKVVLVIGGTSGIGFEIVKRFSEEGAYVITCGRDNEKGINTINRLNGDVNKTVFIKCDIGIRNDIENLFHIIKDKYNKLDIAINNASIFCMGKTLHEYNFDEYNEVININLTGTFLCMQEEIKMMLKSNGGCIVNILSTASIGAQTYGSAPYIISKHGEAGLTKVAALEYAEKGIRVNGIIPGMTDTELLRRMANDKMITDIISKYPMKRLVNPIEVAETALFLSSDAASGINGVLLAIDEGKSAST